MRSGYFGFWIFVAAMISFVAWAVMVKTSIRVIEYSKHVCSGATFGTPKHPKPEMPKEEIK